MSFSYITGIPNPPINPSVDSPNMQTNTNTIASWVAVDHVGFNQSLAGKHNQITFPANNVPGMPPSDPSSIIFTAPGTANAASPQLFWQNSQAIFQISPIRAWAVISGNTNGASTIYNGTSSLFSSITTNSSNWTTTVNMNANVVNSGNYCVIASCTFPYSGVPLNDCVVVNYTIASATQFTLKTIAPQANSVCPVSSISFAVLQI
jgi:hypothetical protein